ncbi:DoxX family protein [Lujinxingia litoralis]|uniref:DoxX family protein n=1 Tax=Lujinxingia litoralis TaxID=2211119 RepID=A0A328C745_9DELT|nr:DoxX family protein [Lujinxingia litoralis]RAL20354.1 DoxX family protein [Lujinxingia litoralis]
MSDLRKSSFLMGRIVAGFFYLIMGLNHFGQWGSLSAYAAEKGVPWASLAVGVSGVLLVMGGISVALGLRPVLGVLCVVLALLPITLIMHNFWAIDDAAARQIELTSFLKNGGLIGSALIFTAIRHPWPMSLDEWLDTWSFRQRLRQAEEP